MEARNDTVVEIKNLKKAFGELQVLKDFSVSLKKGENLVVIGRSGVGKSVLIKLMVGLIKPDGGTLDVLGQNVPDLNHNQLDEMRKKIGFLFQGSALYDSMTVRENLEFPLRTLKKQKTKAEMLEKVKSALEEVGLPDTINMMPQDLSGGMKKRIGLARALIRQPEIVLYDEPTTGLDPVTSREISDLILQVQKRLNASSVIITHDIPCAEITGNRIIVLEDGKCHAEGTFEELKKSDDPSVKSFFK